MAVTIAVKTLHLIDRTIEADQGASYREWLGRVIPHIGDAYRGEEDGHRSHLGASILGTDCGRAIWYNFRWATRAKFDSKALRLFNRGHLEEARFIAILLTIGCQVYQQDNEGKQYRISFAEGHGGGSGDGIALGVPDIPAQTYFLLEFKTHGEKSFIELAGKLEDWRAYVASGGKLKFPGLGVRQAKLEHYVQMQLYMYKMGLACALYMAVNKNTDDLYAEIVTLDQDFAAQFIDRGEKIIWMPGIPDRINKSPGFWKCRFCDHRPVCHLDAEPDRNCRTCVFSEPRPGAEWYCNVHKKPINKELQLASCANYEVSKLFKS